MTHLNRFANRFKVNRFRLSYVTSHLRGERDIDGGPAGHHGDGLAAGGGGLSGSSWLSSVEQEVQRPTLEAYLGRNVEPGFRNLEWQWTITIFDITDCTLVETNQLHNYLKVTINKVVIYNKLCTKSWLLNLVS